jgi:hypothetical protein
MMDGSWDFHEGMAIVRLKDKNYYIDKRGSKILEPQFDDLQPFRNGLARVGTAGKYGYIDKFGKLIWQPTK